MSLPITEDTPPDMLAGSMDLKVVLPDGHSVKMSVQRGTPMMDLLVQVTTAHCLSPGDFSLQAMGDKGVLPFKPNTPIGALDTFTVKIVEKKLQTRGRAPQVPQSFLNTFRLQVHLPRSQLFVLRVTPEVTLSEIMTHICTEKNLNIDKYEFRNPGNLEVLELDKTLGDYKLQELSMMSKGNRTVTGLMSSADIMNVKSSKHRQNSVCDSSLSSGSFGSRSGSPIPPITVVTMPPQPPIRKKRRPAPKPPTLAENEKKEQTTASVLISHSRESSDSSGYHEASVLSESPTNGSPEGRIESDSPPDTLPRRSKLPPSQSFTNLTSIQPAPKSQLKSSISNTSLNSNGCSRKKRAPPPPPAQPTTREDKIKSSTLPTSVAEERRNLSSDGGSFRYFHVNATLDVSNTKVQNLVENTSETKASKDEMPASLDVEVRLPPKPKPRTSIPKTPPAKTLSQRTLASLDVRGSDLEDLPGESGYLNRWKNFENLTEEKEEEIPVMEGEKESVEKKPSCEQPDGSEYPADHDSINWEYQLPPPPTDFRDTNSPSCTEFSTITITPEVLGEDPIQRVPSPEKPKNILATLCNESPKNIEKKYSHNKSVVMNELTNILSGNKKFKEKSLSVSNLYINESDYKKNALNYSRSFSTEPAPSLDNFKLTTYQSNGLGNNKKLSTSNEVICNNSEINYRNNKNLEKSSSMECIQTHTLDSYKIIGKTEDVFRKPVAPVQKKLKVAKRSASSVGANHKRNSLESSHTWEEDENINILQQQFLEFLREKKLNSDLKMKSLDVIRNLLPELSGVEKEHNQNNESISQENAQQDVHEKIRIVDVKVKPPVPAEEAEKVSLRHEKKETYNSPEKKPEATKRYSYQGPPSINFSTWGERPKTTRIIIKDEDYVTQDKLTEKKSEMIQKNGDINQKPKEVKKRAQIIIKKPGVLSRYEMFSALPKRKEMSSLELIHSEDEERKRKMEEKEHSRVPVVCGMELKKEFKPPSPIKPETKPKHSVSVYVNGSQRPERGLGGQKDGPTSNYNFIVSKRNSVLVPVVKGFRPLEQNVISVNRDQTVPPPPPPPLASLEKPKPVAAGASKQRPTSQDPRDQLLDEIRNFGGLRKLKRSTVR